MTIEHNGQLPEPIVLDPWVNILGRFGVEPQRMEIVALALQQMGITPERLPEAVAEWSTLVQPGEKFPGFSHGKEFQIAQLLSGIRKLDEDPS